MKNLSLTKLTAFLEKPKVTECLLLVFVFCYGIIYTNILSGSWFEDDPLVFYSVKSADNPFAFFFDSDFFESGSKHQIAPFLYFSLWFDSFFSKETIKFAYGHNFVALLITAFLFFKASIFLFQRRAISLLFVMLWLLLPSTQAIYEFVAARHYLEGLMISILSIYLLWKSVIEENRTTSIVLACASSLCLLCAVFFKEIYAASTLLLFFAICFFKRRYWGLAVSIIFGGFYYLYRSWAVGTSVYYGSPLVSGGDLLKYASHLPFMVTANYGGWLLLVFTIFGLCYLIYKKLAPLSVSVSLMTFVALGAALTYPVSFALLYYWQEPGTYYRWCFLFATFLLSALFYLISMSNRKVATVLLVTAFLSIGLGSLKTQRYFLAEKEKYKVEAATYLKEPRKLFYSQVSAWFFLFGLTKLNNLDEMHFVNKTDLTPKWLTAKILREKYETIWKLENGVLVKDDELYNKILDKYSKAK